MVRGALVVAAFLPVAPAAADGIRNSDFPSPGPRHETLKREVAWRFPREFRSIDGTYNNRANPLWGSADTELLRLTSVGYADGANSPAGPARKSAREISNLCVNQDELVSNDRNASDFIWQWGQFLDHDIDLVATASDEPLPVQVPYGDAYFDTGLTGTETLAFNRSFYRIVDGVREQVNELTAYVDASHVYGSDPARALELRLLDGTGRLKTSAGNLLPYNVNGYPNAPDDSLANFFLAGDVRANEQVGLTAMHTLFVREHNFWAGFFRAVKPFASDENIYSYARVMVGAEIQAITYNEFLPVLLGRNALAPWSGYKPQVNAGIANVFAAAAFRLGHTLLSPEIQRLRADGRPIPQGSLALRDAFFAPARITDEGGIDPIFRGLAAQQAQELDAQAVHGVRNFLFGEPGLGGSDLVSLNIQRGRDHGLPGYNQLRRDFGLAPVSTFADISSDPVVQSRLALAYASVEDVDPWLGLMCEDHVESAMVGETLYVILKEQFERLRDGDRFWYQRHLPPFLAALVDEQTLARIIRRNTGIGGELQNDVFRVPENCRHRGRPDHGGHEHR